MSSEHLSTDTQGPYALMPIIPLRGIVLMPGVAVPLLVGRPRSTEALRAALENKRQVAFVAQREAATDEPTAEDLLDVGTVGRIIEHETDDEGNYEVVVRGQWRFRFESFEETEPYLLARITPLPDESPADGIDAEEIRRLRAAASAYVELSMEEPGELLRLIESVPAPDPLCYLLASGLGIDFETRQALLEERRPDERTRMMLDVLQEQMEIEKLTQRFHEEGRGLITEEDRESFLRRNLEQVRSELSDLSGTRGPDTSEIQEKIEQAELPESIQPEIERELARLSRIPPGSPEYGMVESYLNWIASLPWQKQTEEKLDIRRAQEILNRNHYDIVDVKERILEYLATRKLRRRPSGVILCLAGPPGVGKTSLGHSIAEAMNRKLARISLGGVNDEAEIRGHRRTYVGALPGRIIRVLRQTEVNNPLVVLDEVDKLSVSFRGDPTAALLEVLDPEQNAEFVDHYLGVPFDLSKVFFLATANTSVTIPPTLQDRMEMITLPGYTPEEKFHIARKYLIPRQTRATGLKEEQLQVNDEAVDLLIDQYSREAGVRSLERQIASLCRKAARRVVEQEALERVITPGKVEEILGPPPFRQARLTEGEQPGVVAAVIMTKTGADMETVESYFVPGKGGLSVTGRAGEVLKESAQTAVSHFKAIGDELGVDPDLLTKNDIHVHFTRPVVPLDTSASGLSIFMSLVSRALNVALDPETCYFGEITLRGRVLRVAHLRERFVCAKRYRFRRVLMPRRNEPDLADIPDEVKAHLEVRMVGTTREALEVMLPAGTGKAGSTAS